MKKRKNARKARRKARAKAAARQKQVLKHPKAEKKVANPSIPSQKKESAGEQRAGYFHSLDIEDAIVAASRLRFMTLGEKVGPLTQMNRPTIALLREFFQALTTGDSASVLQWPLGQRDISLIHPLAMLTLICTPAKRTTGKDEWCDAPHSLRTLYFPWRGGATASAQSSLLIHRAEVISWNRYHLMRRYIQSFKPFDLLDGLHQTLGNLCNLNRRDTTKPHLAHPTLAEIYPVFIAEGDESQTRDFGEAIRELFGRVKHGATLDRLTDHRPMLSAPETAPYGFFGVSPRAQFQLALDAPAISTNHGRPPDICLLDLGPPALSRLGTTWVETVKNFVAEVIRHFPTLPFMAVTQDPYIHQRITGILRTTLRPKMARSRVFVRISRDPLSTDEPVENISNTRVCFTTFAGPTADAMAALSEAARGSSDSAFAGILRRTMGSLRKAASLPCGLGPAYEFLCHDIGQDAAERFLGHRSCGTLLAPLQEALESEIGGAERSRLIRARDALQATFENFEVETPIGSLLASFVTTILRESGRTMIAFATQDDLKLGVHRLTDDVDDSELGRAMCHRLGEGDIIFASADDLDAKLTDIEKARDRDIWKRLVLIAPSLAWLSRVTAHAWLPEELIVLCERTLGARVAEIFQRLASQPDLAGDGQLGERLAHVAEAAKSDVEARGVRSVELDLEPWAETSAGETIIDLVDEDYDDGSGGILLTLASGRKLRARPASAVICYGQNAEINPFKRTRARDVHVGDTVVVPDNVFIEEAREVLPIRVLAQTWVEVYHSTVEAHLAGIPGDTLSAKARKVWADIQAQGARTQSHAAVLDWLKVEEYKQLPPESRPPHAPQHRREFEAFMSVLGVNEALADKMWMEGIQPLRIDRRRAGQKMAQAFVSVLVDPHGTASGLSASIREGIETLRRKALDHLDQVTGLETIDIGERHE